MTRVEIALRIYCTLLLIDEPVYAGVDLEHEAFSRADSFLEYERKTPPPSPSPAKGGHASGDAAGSSPLAPAGGTATSPPVSAPQAPGSGGGSEPGPSSLCEAFDCGRLGLWGVTLYGPHGQPDETAWFCVEHRGAPEHLHREMHKDAMARAKGGGR